MSFARIARQAARSVRAAGPNERATITSIKPALLVSARAARPFSTSPTHLKKRKPDAPSKSSSSPAPAPAAKAKSSSSGGNDDFDPLDLDPVSAAFAEVDAHFQTQVQNVLHGGRFNPNQLGALPVSIKPEHPSSNNPPAAAAEEFPLRELAQVVPRGGRTVSLLVNDKAYIKPIMSAVQASLDFNQQPQRADDNELELLLRVEMERPEELARRVKQATQAWRERVRQARAKHDKALKEARKKGVLLPDTLKKVEKEVQKLQDRKMKEIDALEAQSVKQVGGGK